MAAIKVGKGTNLNMHNVRIINSDVAIDAEEARLSLNQVDITRNRVGLKLKDSSARITRSNISGNQIDILVENKVDRTSVEILDSIVRNIIVNGINVYINSHPTTLEIDPYRLRAVVNDYLKPDTPNAKRAKFKKILTLLYRYGKHAKDLYSLLQLILQYLGS